MKKAKGFTLIELLVVIAIIGLLSTLAVVALNSAREKARDAKRTADVKRIQIALELYFDSAGGYPAEGANVTLGGTGGGTLSVDGGLGDTASGTIFMSSIPAAPTPPTANAYVYQLNQAASETTTSSYQIEFTLESSVGDIASGINCASPTGITSGACSL